MLTAQKSHFDFSSWSCSVLWV